MAFQIPSEQVKMLENLHSVVRFKHRNVKKDNGDKVDVTLCVVTDKYMGKQWAIGVSDGTGDEAEKRSLTDALSKLNPGDRPLTPPELAAENTRLRKELAEARGDNVPDDTPSTEDPAKKENVADQETMLVGDPVEGLSANDIVKMLEAKNIPVPEGDRRTTEWRATASRLISQLD